MPRLLMCLLVLLAMVDGRQPRERGGGRQPRTPQRDGGRQPRNPQRDGGRQPRNPQRDGGRQPRNPQRDGQREPRNPQRDSGRQPRNPQRDSGQRTQRGGGQRDPCKSAAADKCTQTCSSCMSCYRQRGDPDKCEVCAECKQCDKYKNCNSERKKGDCSNQLAKDCQQECVDCMDCCDGDKLHSGSGCKDCAECEECCEFRSCGKKRRKGRAAAGDPNDDKGGCKSTNSKKCWAEGGCSSCMSCYQLYGDPKQCEIPGEFDCSDCLKCEKYKDCYKYDGDCSNPLARDCAKECPDCMGCCKGDKINPDDKTCADCKDCEDCCVFSKCQVVSNAAADAFVKQQVLQLKKQGKIQEALAIMRKNKARQKMKANDNDNEDTNAKEQQVSEMLDEL